MRRAKLLLTILSVYLVVSVVDYVEKQIIDEEMGGMINYDFSSTTYNRMLEERAAAWEVDPMVLHEAIEKMGYHESAHTFDPNIEQRLSDGTVGRGKGIFQFEISVDGNQGGGATAYNRTTRYFKEMNNQGHNMPIPEWVDTDVYAENFDATTLDQDGQYILMLANMAGAPEVTKQALSSISFGGKIDNDSLAELWLNSHWKGDIQDRKARKSSFMSSANKYDKEFK